MSRCEVCAADLDDPATGFGPCQTASCRHLVAQHGPAVPVPDALRAALSDPSLRTPDQRALIEDVREASADFVRPQEDEGPGVALVLAERLDHVHGQLRETGERAAHAKGVLAEWDARRLDVPAERDDLAAQLRELTECATRSETKRDAVRALVPPRELRRLPGATGG